MILAVHSDASYLSETKPESGRRPFLLTKMTRYPEQRTRAPTSRRHTNPHLLTELGHTQPPTPIQIDNSTALGVVTNTIQPKRTKAMDMRFHWLRCRTN
eukprot:CCRYP_020918-RA/>CCRYP_020918-RA protein AED:0.39 eAED:0.39 QI:0/0/0/1/0/0/2/0/98